MLVALRPPLRLPRAQPARDNVFGFLARRFTPRTVFMEIGAAGYELALRAAGYVERVYAIDVSGQLLRDVLVPCNLRLVLCDGVRIPVPAASIDVAWSGNFLDHLHPDDAREHLAGVRRSLAEGGEYVCASADPARLRAWLLQAGFSRVSCYLGAVRIAWVAAALFPEKLLRICALR
jgi:SAM-dependent methyltransferase